MEDFIEALDFCELSSPPVSGGTFTWFGNRSKGRVFRRLDRVLNNEKLFDLFSEVSVRHKGRGLSDHKALLVLLNNPLPSCPRPFRFLDVWTSHPGFNQLISENWDKSYKGGGMKELAERLLSTKKILKKWNVVTFGDIFKGVREAEARAILAQEKLEINDSEEALLEANLANALLTQACKREEIFWSQKANIKWIKNGDASTKYFHSVVRARRHSLKINNIKNMQGVNLSSEIDISNAAVDYFSDIFHFKTVEHLEQALEHILPTLDNNDNLSLSKIPDEEEIRSSIWKLSASSAAGPDGFNGTFFRHCWSTIHLHVTKAVQEYFIGVPLPQTFGSTTITLLPKKDSCTNFNDYRPISLSTFFSKIITRIMSDRLKPLLHKIISEEQAAYQTGKGIEEHILLTKEMVHMLASGHRGGNIIIKLDLCKAFDTISWTFLEAILSKFGFSQHTILLLMGVLKGTWFSILVNGFPKGFFPMKRGVKQGDPLSPLLFIIAMEGLSKSIKSNMTLGFLKPFHTGLVVAPSHLLYADDLIIFTNGETRNLIKVKHILSSFMKASGQSINLSKSQVIVHHKMPIDRRSCISKILGIKTSSGSFKYLGSCISKGKLRKNQMGRYVLIKHVLSAIPMHTLLVQDLPKSVINSLNKIMANFLWGSKEAKNKHHCRKWADLCFSLEEGGLGFRSIEDIQAAAALQLWWKVQQGGTVWRNYMRNKYMRDGEFKAMRIVENGYLSFPLSFLPWTHCHN
ncbi:unnamed protein product [Cuscuta campestris]|uniref:Reverse transcriptase domain-containing protein n=1 Tax=Cuscuta campestris TaxID=132261 RepID=A0A484NC17_9ASTE|nr:unnamed protein product [Cuscuta campestris]